MVRISQWFGSERVQASTSAFKPQRHCQHPCRAIVAFEEILLDEGSDRTPRLVKENGGGRKHAQACDLAKTRRASGLPPRFPFFSPSSHHRASKSTIPRVYATNAAQDGLLEVNASISLQPSITSMAFRSPHNWTGLICGPTEPNCGSSSYTCNKRSHTALIGSASSSRYALGLPSAKSYCLSEFILPLMLRCPCQTGPSEKRNHYRFDYGARTRGSIDRPRITLSQ